MYSIVHGGGVKPKRIYKQSIVNIGQLHFHHLHPAAAAAAAADAGNSRCQSTLLFVSFFFIDCDKYCHTFHIFQKQSQLFCHFYKNNTDC